MVADKTLITETCTGLGMLGGADVDSALAFQPPEFKGFDDGDFERLRTLRLEPKFGPLFQAPFENGLAFSRAEDGLNGRRPRIIEWTGGRKSPGDELVPADLRIDHVYLVSCKYLSKLLYNASPARLFEHALTRQPIGDRRNWYQRTSPETYEELYRICVSVFGLTTFPERPDEMNKAQCKELASLLKGAPWPPPALAVYQELCDQVSRSTVELWKHYLPRSEHEQLTWRLLRVGSAPYFVLGTSSVGVMRLRVATPWDVRQHFKFRGLSFDATAAGQPRVAWSASFEERASGRPIVVHGHVEIRWSHGRFSGPPEAKIYLDTPHHEVPGYFPLGP